MQTVSPAAAALLTGTRLEVTAGLDLLDQDLGFIEEASDDLQGGTIHRSMAARIHGTCTLHLSRQLTWADTLVRPWMLLSDGAQSSRFDLGVFVLTTPQRPVGETPETVSVQGYDRLYLLDRQVGDSYEVAAGAGYVAAMRQAISDAGLSGALIDSTAQDSELPEAMVWPLVPGGGSGQPATWLGVLNDLAAAVNYTGFWADELGRFRCGPYADPSTRPVEWVFDADSPATIVADRTVIEDGWQQPNLWIFLQANRTDAPSEGDGIFTVDESGDGLAWPVQTTVDVADQAALEAFAARAVAASKRRASTLQVSTGPFPAAGHADVFAYRDRAVGELKVQATEWDFDLAGSDVRWTWETT